MKRNNAGNKYKWDFSHLFNNIEDWKENLQIVKEMLEELVAFRGKLNNEEKFIKFILQEEKINFLITKLAQYLHMADIDTTNLKYQELNGIFSNLLTEMSAKLAFVSPEIKNIGEQKIMMWIRNNHNLSHYEYSYRQFFRSAKYILSEREEELLSLVSQSRSTAGELYDLLAYADKKPTYIFYKDQECELTSALYSEIMENTDAHQDQKLRLTASKLFVQHLTDKKHSLAKVYEGIIQHSVESVRIRKYDSTLQASLLSDNVDQSIYENLIKVGKKYSNLFVEYNNLIKSYFNLDKYYPTDRMLKFIPKKIDSEKIYDVEEAKDIIRQTLSILGTDYQKALEQAWSDNRIDYYEDTNKRSGAYSSGGSGVDPIILMNWDNTINSVNTLIHEIGHSVHTIFADDNNKYPLNNYPIILAEVASTVNEHLLFDYMYKNSTNIDEKIYLLQNRIDEIMATFFRQIQFADFEWEAHKMVENNEPLNADKLEDLFNKKADEFGYTVFDKTEKSYGWPRILHFFNSPYYVYKYATCIVASFKIYHDVINNKVETLINFLKKGGSKEPLLILKEIGIDYCDSAVYSPLMDKLREMIEELKNLLEQKKRA